MVPAVVNGCGGGVAPAAAVSWKIVPAPSVANARLPVEPGVTGTPVT